MPRLLIGNFDFEQRLASARPSPPALLRLSAELATSWLAIAVEDDLLLSPGEANGAFWQYLQRELPWQLPGIVRDMRASPERIATPWGWDDQVLADSLAAGLTVPPRPDRETVRAVNSRRFSLLLEEELGCAPPRTAWLTSLDEISRALREMEGASADSRPAQWIIKAKFSHSARERLVGQGKALTPPELAWLIARLRRDGGVAVEPWLEIVAQAGIQWDVPREGEPLLAGVTPLLTDPLGRYRGSVFAAESVELEWSDPITFSREAARRVQAAGYFGPLGIDACRYRDADGRLRTRPLMDVNARWTMGRLALGWRRLLAPGETGVWRHGPPQAHLDDEFDATTPTRVIETSPAELDGAPTRIRHRVEVYSVRPSG